MSDCLSKGELDRLDRIAKKERKAIRDKRFQAENERKDTWAKRCYAQRKQGRQHLTVENDSSTVRYVHLSPEDKAALVAKYS